MKKSFTTIFIFCICVFSCWPFGKSKKQKVIDAILSNKNVSEIVEIRGHDDWETKYFFVKLILTDGTKLMLRGVDFKSSETKTKDLHFIEIWLINDLSFVQLQFDYQQQKHVYIWQIQNPPVGCSENLRQLYSEKSVDYLINNHNAILADLEKYPKVPDTFVDEFLVGSDSQLENLKNYHFVNFDLERGKYPVIISSEKYQKW